MQTQLKKQSDVCYSDRHFVNSSLDNPHLFGNRKSRVFKILEHLLLSGCTDELQ